MALAAAAAAIMDEEHVENTKQVNTAGREQLYKAFRELGLEFTESMSNFILGACMGKRRDHHCRP